MFLWALEDPLYLLHDCLQLQKSGFGDSCSAHSPYSPYMFMNNFISVYKIFCIFCYSWLAREESWQSLPLFTTM